MPYQVLQDGKPCAEYGFPTWDKDTFDSLYAATKFAAQWVFGGVGASEFYCMVYAEREPFKVNEERDMSRCEVPIIMKVIEV